MRRRDAARHFLPVAKAERRELRDEPEWPASVRQEQALRAGLPWKRRDAEQQAQPERQNEPSQLVAKAP